MTSQLEKPTSWHVNEYFFASQRRQQVLQRSIKYTCLYLERLKSLITFCVVYILIMKNSSLFCAKNIEKNHFDSKSNDQSIDIHRCSYLLSLFRFIYLQRTNIRLSSLTQVFHSIIKHSRHLNKLYSGQSHQAVYSMNQCFVFLLCIAQVRQYYSMTGKSYERKSKCWVYTLHLRMTKHTCKESQRCYLFIK